MQCKGQKFGHDFFQGICKTCKDSQQGLTVSHRGRAYEKEKEELGKHKIETYRQELGLKMAKSFGKSVWWIVNKKNKDKSEFIYSETSLHVAFKKRQEEGVYRIDYLLNDLKNV